MSKRHEPIQRLTISSAESTVKGGELLPTINYLLKEVTRMSRDIYKLKSDLTSSEVGEAAVVEVEDLIKVASRQMLLLSDKNVRTQTALKKINDAHKKHTVYHNCVTLTATEAINRILVGLK